jgi:hypothetical protein
MDAVELALPLRLQLAQPKKAAFERYQRRRHRSGAAT